MTIDRTFRDKIAFVIRVADVFFYDLRKAWIANTAIYMFTQSICSGSLLKETGRRR